MKKTVSVIIPCYNGEKVINRSIESVYSQESNYLIELIVVDDGSTDNSKNMILAWKTKFEQKDFVLKYIYQENGGSGSATNTGLKAVTGEYLTLLDADDMFLANSISVRADFLEANKKYVGVQTNGWQDKNGERKLFITNEKEKRNENLFDGLVGGNAVNWAGSYMIRTQELFDFYPDREIYTSRFGQNMQILLPLAYRQKFKFIDKPLMVYFIHNNSLTQADSAEKQLKKNDTNFYGFQDIYMTVIDKVVKDSKDREYYFNILDSWKYNHELGKAIRIQDKKQAHYYYEKYKATGRMTLNDKINYYYFISKPIAFILRIYRKIKLFNKE